MTGSWIPGKEKSTEEFCPISFSRMYWTSPLLGLAGSRKYRPQTPCSGWEGLLVVVSSWMYMPLYVFSLLVPCSLSPPSRLSFERVRPATHQHRGTSVSKIYLSDSSKTKGSEQTKTPWLCFMILITMQGRNPCYILCTLTSPATRRGSVIKIPVTKPLCFKVVLVSSQPNHWR